MVNAIPQVSTACLAIQQGSCTKLMIATAVQPHACQQDKAPKQQCNWAQQYDPGNNPGGAIRKLDVSLQPVHAVQDLL
jgi:hypothetical protein